MHIVCVIYCTEIIIKFHVLLAFLTISAPLLYILKHLQFEDIMAHNIETVLKIY